VLFRKEYRINLAFKMRMPDLISIYVRLLEFIREYMIDLALKNIYKNVGFISICVSIRIYVIFKREYQIDWLSK
jgi:hypothetical protein